MAACVLGVAGFVTCFTVAHSWGWGIAAGAAILGVGIGFAFSSLVNVLVAAVEPHETAEATGVNTIVRTVGGALGAQGSGGDRDGTHQHRRAPGGVGLHHRVRRLGGRDGGRGPALTHPSPAYADIVGRRCRRADSPGQMTAGPVTPYGHPPLFGVVLTPDARDPGGTVDLAVHAEKAGLDLVGAVRSPLPPRLHGRLDTAQLDRRPHPAGERDAERRQPAAAATGRTGQGRRHGDLLSGGRVELGVGAGGHGHAIHSEGGSAATVGERISAFAEALTIIRALTTAGSPVTLDGKYHRVYEAVPGPAHPHPIGLWIGGVGPRMLRLVGRLGDGWIPSATRLPPEGLDAANARIDQAARVAERDPGEIRRLANLPGALGSHTRSWAAQLTDLALRRGISGFLLFTDDRDTIARFGGDVAPAVQDALR